MLSQTPISVTVPSWGVAFAESRHHPKFRMPERADPFHKFFLVNEGQTRLHLRGEHFEDLHASHIFFVPALTTHHLEDRRPTSLLILCLDPEFPKLLRSFHPVWEQSLLHLNKPVLPSGIIAHRLDSLWRRGIREQETPSAHRPLHHQLLAMEIIVTLVRAARYPRKEDPRQRIRQFLELLEAEFFENWNVERAASMVQLSRRRFSDYFREITGQSFVEKLTAIRIEKAKDLMQMGEYSIAGAGFSSGFNDLSHFYRTFKKHTGLAPGEWLRKHSS